MFTRRALAGDEEISLKAGAELVDIQPLMLEQVNLATTQIYTHISANAIAEWWRGFTDTSHFGRPRSLALSRTVPVPRLKRARSV